MRGLSSNSNADSPGKSSNVKSPHSLFCQHMFVDLWCRDLKPALGKEVWLFCCYCTMTVKKILTDESSQL